MNSIGSLRVLLLGNKDLVDCFLEIGQGGSKIDRGLASQLSSSLGPTFEVVVAHQLEPRFKDLADDFESRNWIPDPPPNVVVLSLHSDLLFAFDSVLMGEGGPPAKDVETSLLSLIRYVKENWMSHVIVLNSSTVDPRNRVSDFLVTSIEPRSLLAQRLNIVLMRLSFQEGISIVDADRILAELGAANHVIDFLDYSPTAASAICTELVRILEDYGFLDERPLMLQKGQTP